MGTDHFADLLGQVGKKNDSQKSLNERQRSMTPSSGGVKKSADFDFLDKLSKTSSPQASSPKASSPNHHLDSIFSAFDAPQSHVAVPETIEKVPREVNQAKVSDSLFLDEEFEDLVSMDVSNQSVALNDNATTSIPTHSTSPRGKTESGASHRDRALAELVDMGFSVSRSSSALDQTDTGHNAEQAVGFLLSDTESSKRPEDFGSLMNSLSEGLMSKASLFFDQSRNTIAKGLESYKESQRSETPTWMDEQINPPIPARRKPSLPARRKEASSVGAESRPALPVRRTNKKPEIPVGPKPVSISPAQLQMFKEKNEHSKGLFLQGDFAASQLGYEDALKALPDNHLLRVLVYSNLAMCYSKLGSVKQSVAMCDSGLELLKGIDLSEEEIDGKKAKEFWSKLMQRKAQGLEQQELYAMALDCYKTLIENGSCSKATMDGKRRCMDILEPKPVKKPAVPPSSSIKTAKKQTVKKDSTDEKDEVLEEATREKISQWKSGKEDNLRALISSLHLVLWDDANWTPIGMADLISPKKVKLAYMKAVSKTHPDKVSGKSMEQKLIAHDVFIVINQAWENFKETNDV